MDFTVVYGIGRDALPVCYKDAEMIWVWHLMINRNYFHFESTFQHVILHIPRANNLCILAEGHKLILSRLSGGRGCLNFFKAQFRDNFVCVGAWERCLIIVISISLILLQHFHLLAEHSELLLSVKESGVKKFPPF